MPSAMTSFLVLGVLLVLTPAVQPSRRDYTGYKLVEVIPTRESHVAALNELEELQGVDFWTPAHLSFPVSILLSPAQYKDISERLEELGMPVTVKNNNIQEAMEMERTTNERARSRISKRSQMSIVNTFPQFDDINEWIEELKANNPEIVQTEEIGQTYEGRTMKLIKIGKPRENGGTKPAVWLDAGIHAREWLTVATLVYIIERLVNDYHTSAEVGNLVDYYDWIILPVANPDGYEYTHTERLWRKTRSPGSWFCKGADPNRNFGYQWRVSGTSTSPCSDTYGGGAEFSEKCTQNMRDAILNYADRLKLYFSLHSYSQLWLTPWAYANVKPSDIAELERVAEIGKRALKAVNGRDFEIGNPPTILYPASGGSYDWAKAVAGVKYSYVLELYPGRDSSNGFIVSTSAIQGSGKEIWAALKAVVNAIED